MPCIIGLDFGTESARGVLVNVETGKEECHHVHPYRHHIISSKLPNGSRLPVGTALQDPQDYLEAAEDILTTIATGQEVVGIGIDFTASSPMPVTDDGVPLSLFYPNNPHAYVKLWKHATAQKYADALNAAGGQYLDHCGGKVSGEWMLAKAAQIEDEDPTLWSKTGRFIEAGDWLVWQLSGNEVRSMDFAAYKMHYTETQGYPATNSESLREHVTLPKPVGTSAGILTREWLQKTGILGDPAIAVAVIDSHVVLPAVGAVGPGTLVGALGTSAVFLLLDDEADGLPKGLESMAYNAVLPDVWCFEAGLAGFGDMLSWFVRTFPRSSISSENFRLYNEEAAKLEPGENHLVTLDWWSGNRVPYADSALSGVISGLTMGTTAAGIYRSLLEAVCYGARGIVEALEDGGHRIQRILLTSGLAHNNPLLIQIAADVLGRQVDVPDIKNPTAIGAAIHGAVAGGVVDSFAEGAKRFGGGNETKVYTPVPSHSAVYDDLYRSYRMMADSESVRKALHTIRQTAEVSSTRRRES